MKNTLKKIFQISVLAICVFSLYGCESSRRAQVKKEKIGEIELAYYTRGSGEPLVMIMGFRGTMAAWDPALLEILEKKYTLVLFDNRGVGFSSDTEEMQTTIPQMAEDTAQLIQALGYQKAHILGWSMGSRIALELTLHHPEMVDALILCSPNPGGKHQAPRRLKAYAKLAAKELPPEEALSLLFPHTPEGNEAGASLMSRLTKAMLNGSVPNDVVISEQTVDRQVQALKLWDKSNEVYEALPQIRRPTLVAGGLEDELDHPDNIRLVASQIPFAWTAYFAGAGHDFLSQDHRRFAELATLFIESH